MIDISSKIQDFLNDFQSHENDIYNEFSLQHELGIFLREKLSKEYKVQFERNISDFGKAIDKSHYEKKEIDIVIFKGETPENSTEKYAIELKYPKNGQTPKEMFYFIQDICFMEQVKKNLQFDETFVLTLADDKKFYSDSGNLKTDGIYKYFRGKNPAEIKKGKIENPVKDKDGRKTLKLESNYKIEWKEITNSRNKDLRYYRFPKE